MKPYYKKLDEGTIVIISSDKFEKNTYVVAKICQVIEQNLFEKGKLRTTSYKYNLRTVNFPESPYDSFPFKDKEEESSFIDYDELSYFETVEGFKTNFLHYINPFLNT